MTAGTVLGAAAVILLVCATSPATANRANMISLVNTTRTALVSFQLRQSGTSAWEPNALGQHALGVRKKTAINVSGGCIFDVISSFEDGHRKLTPRVDLCGVQEFVVKDN